MNIVSKYEARGHTMARPRRICLSNLTYQIYSRCIEWRPMMSENRFKELFIEVLKKTMARYDFKLIFYKINDRDIHLVIKTTPNGASISRIMQYLKARFAENYNRLNSRIGPFWNERFKDIIIEFLKNPEEYFLNFLLKCGDITQTPSKASFNRAAGIFNALSFYLYGNVRSDIKITHHEYFLNLGKSFHERVKKFSSLRTVVD